MVGNLIYLGSKNRFIMIMSSEIFLVSILFLGISFIVSAILKSKFSKYSKIPLSNGLSGREIAEKMLQENGIFDVKVTSVNGFLSDHYNPANKMSIIMVLKEYKPSTVFTGVIGCTVIVSSPA